MELGKERQRFRGLGEHMRVVDEPSSDVGCNNSRRIGVLDRQLLTVSAVPASCSVNIAELIIQNYNYEVDYIL